MYHGMRLFGGNDKHPSSPHLLSRKKKENPLLSSSSHHILIASSTANTLFLIPREKGEEEEKMPIFQGFERKRVLLKWESSEKKWRGRGLGVLGDWEKKGKEEDLERCYPSRSSFWLISIGFLLVLQQNLSSAVRQKIFCQINL